MSISLGDPVPYLRGLYQLIPEERLAFILRRAGRQSRLRRLFAQLDEEESKALARLVGRWNGAFPREELSQECRKTAQLYDGTLILERVGW